MSQKTEKKTQQRLHSDSMVFFEHAGSVKKRIVIINDPFVSQCTVRLVDKPQDTARELQELRMMAGIGIEVGLQESGSKLA